MVESGGSRSASGGQRVPISIREFAAVTAGVATVVGSTVVLHPPITPWVKWFTVVYSALSMVLFLVGFFMHFGWRKSRHAGVRKLYEAVAGIVKVRAMDAFLLAVASGVLLAASVLWPAPDRRQIAQQMLNDRGMFLEPLYFQTAIEVGNASGVSLFLDAGFPTPLAASLFGAEAGTVPGKRVIDTFFDLEEETRHLILGHLARASGEADSEGGPRSVFNLWLDPGNQGDPVEGQALTGPRIDLLGYALERDDRSTVEMLRLGADPYRSVAAFLHRPEQGVSLARARNAVLSKDPDQWEFAADVYRYASSVDSGSGIGEATISAMMNRGVAPGYCDKDGVCELGDRRSRRSELRGAKCVVKHLVNQGQLLIFVYPDTTLQGGHVLEFKPYPDVELCSGHTVSYYGELTDVLSGERAVGTLRVLRYEGSDTVYISGRGASGSADNVTLLPLLGWQDSMPRRWELGELDHGFGAIFDTAISWSDQEAVDAAGPEPKTCDDDEILSFFGAGSVMLSCEESFSLRSVRPEMDVVFGVKKVEEGLGRPAYWHAANVAEVHFKKGTYSVEARVPQQRTGEARLQVNVEELKLDKGEFGGEYAELSAEGVVREERVESGEGWYAGIAVLNATHVSALLSGLEMDVDMWLTDAQGREVEASRNELTADDRIDALLWPGLYVLAVEAVGEGSSTFRLVIDSQRVVASDADSFPKDGKVGEGGKSFEVLAATDLENVTIGLTELSQDVDIRVFDVEGEEVGSSFNPGVADEEIVAVLWPGQYAVEIEGPANASFRLDMQRSIPALQPLPFSGSGRVREGEERFVRFRIDERKTVSASLTGLSADIDLKIVGKTGELASSANADDSDEWLREELSPGDYLFGIVSFDGDSNYSLEVEEAGAANPEVERNNVNQ